MPGREAGQRPVSCGPLYLSLTLRSATMATVHTRVFLAAGAWLLGVAAATGGSLAAVSLIGQSLAAPPTQQLTVSAVNHALASGKREP